MRKQNFKPLKMNLQLFAKESEGNSAGDSSGSEQDNTPGDGDTGSEEPENEESSEEDASLAEQLAELRVQNAKMKKAMDKAASDAAKYKKQLREKQSVEEIALQEKAEKEAEREEAFQKLLKENTVTKFEKNFLALGYSEELAAKAANAQYDNDTEELFKIQQDFQNALLRQKEAEWAKSRPNPPAGNSEDGTEDAFLKGFNSVSNLRV
ncbi:hypothetical protein D7V86_24510 [bacterium D16-51]|nr:hypothetical protein D7V96_25655 [bacterium D16-59]RKI53896.1 hypothetical protein D7V86_24510 [bacterium D16-51]